MSLIVDFPRECHQPKPAMPNVNHINIKRRAVQFSSTSLLHAYEVPQEESAISSWYSSQDERRFKYQTAQEIMMFLRMNEQGCDATDLPISSQMCPVGLEQRIISRKFIKKRAITKRLVTLTVLKEQACTTATHRGDDKWERIAWASRLHSEWSRTQAQMVGSFQAEQKNEEVI